MNVKDIPLVFRHPGERRDPGGLLLVVLSGILSLLLILSVFFTALSRTERTRTVTGADQVRAKLLARTGVEYAVSRLLEPGNAEPQLGSSPGNAGILPASNPEDDWRYRDEAGIPLEQSLNPSFNQDPYVDTDSNDRYNEGDVFNDPDVNHRYDGWSGRLRGTFGAYSDRFKLRIEDPSGKISVNGALSGSPPSPHEEWMGEPLLEDHNGNGIADPGEPYEDYNGNGWHDDGGPTENIPSGGDWNGNGIWDYLHFQDVNGNALYDPGLDVVVRAFSEDDRNNGKTRSASLPSEGSRGTMLIAGSLYSYWEPYIDANGNKAYDYGGEPYSDLNGNGRWDPADTYEDRNRNGMWDSHLPPAGLAALLQSLGEIMEIADLGRRLLAEWPYPDEASLAEALGDDGPRVMPYLTTWGRPDPSTIRPFPAPFAAGSVLHHQAEWNRVMTPLIEPRVPVAVNLAPVQVLQAVLRPLEGLFLRRECLHPQFYGIHRIGRMEEIRLRQTAADTLVETIHSFRSSGGRFSSWRQWERFLGELTDRVPDNGLQQGQFDRNRREVTPFLLPEEADLIHANVNPNSRLKRFNPDRLLLRHVDKSDLTVWTTEWALDPSGLFELKSQGELYGPGGGKGDAFFRVRGRIELWEIWRDTTQRDFRSGEISENRGGGESPSYRNRSLQRYPEPEFPGRVSADWDGYLLLASNRSESIGGDEPPGETTVQSNPALRFYVRFEKGLDADFSRGSPRCYPETADWHPGAVTPWSQPVWNEPSGRPNENGILHPENPGSIYPDGVYSDWRNVPAYEMRDNLESVAGGVSFWMKVSADPAVRRHCPFSATWNPVWHDGTPKSRRLAIGWASTQTGFIFEPTGHEDSELTPLQVHPPRRGEWHHVGAAWNPSRTLWFEAGTFHFDRDDVELDPDKYYQPRQVTNFRFDTPESPVDYNRGRFRLGEIARPEDLKKDGTYSINDPACATIDEFCLYGFSREGEGFWKSAGTENPFQDPSGVQEVDRTVHEGKYGSEYLQEMRGIWRWQYEHGRYYNRGDASFTRTRMFPPGTGFLRMSWTTLMPEGEYNPASEEGQNLFPGIDQEIDTGGEENQHVNTTEGEGTSPQWRILLDFFDGRKWLLDVNGDGKLSREEERRARALGLTDEGGVPLKMSAQQKGVDTAFRATLSENTVPSDGVIRYRAYFREDADWFTTPLLESPVLDDVTITYVPPGGPRIVKYSE